jgi:Zn-dependent M28 family amino/carboxypeptidase/glyoxylase-like metal-dependent hydrolase (beta-lactamase superfamily II)
MRRATAILLFLLAAPLAAQTAGASPETSINPEVLKAHIRALSADDMEGRGPGTAGAAKARDYIIEKLAASGIEPGPAGWIQKVPLRRVTNGPRAMHVKGGGLDIDLESGEHFVLESARGDGPVEASGEIVYCGHGVQAPEIGWDDFKGVDLKGKVMLVFVGDPQTEDQTLFGGKAMTYYGRWTYKLEKAKELGATGCLIIHRPDWAGYGWLVCQTSWSGRRMDTRGGDYSKELAFGGWVSFSTAEKLTAATGKTIDELAAMAARRDFVPIPLGIEATVKTSVTSENVDDENIVGVLRGGDPARKDEWIIYSAHYDHLGVNPDTKGPDRIYNGALDNASGCAAQLAIADAFGALTERPPRSTMFLFVCSEEQGLLGSRWYAEHPLVPVAKTVANINIDGINLRETTRDVEVTGFGQNDLDGRLAEALKADGRHIVADLEPEKGYYYRSDHFNFARVGIPALYAHGGDIVEGKPAGYMRKLKDEYRARHYHQPSDQFDASWPLTGGAADTRAFFEVGRRLAYGTEWPQWNEKSEFRGVRDASRAKTRDAAVQIHVHAVSKNVYMLEGQGGNIGLATGDDGAFMIDDQFAPLSERIKEAIATVTSQPVRFLVNTHFHADHTGGNESFAKTGSLIVAHENARTRLAAAMAEAAKKDAASAPGPKALPVVTFADALRFHWNGDEIHAFHVAGAHTDGDVILFFAVADVFHLGDVYFNGRYPYIDTQSGGSIDGMIAAVEKVLGMTKDTTKIIPGHGPLSNPAELRAYLEILKRARGTVADLLASGKSADDIVAAKPLADLDAKLSWSFVNGERFLRSVIASLQRSK